MKHWPTPNFFLLITATALLFSGCQDGAKQQVFLPESTGSTNQLMVVTDTELWDSPVGDTIRAHFARPVLGLNREEPIFSIIHIPTQAFKGTYRKGRSVLMVTQDTLSGVQYVRNKFAEAQEIAVVRGTDREALMRGVAKAADSAIFRFKRNEVSEVQRRFRRSLSEATAVTDSFGVTLQIPSVYEPAASARDFVWMDRPIDKGNMNLLFFELPLGRVKADSTLVETVVAIRDSIGRTHVPGPDVPGRVTYMATEKMFAPYIQLTEIGGMKAYEVRGLWQMENYPMGGPYIAYWIEDKARERWIVLDGFVFAPSAIQRDYIFEIEAVFRSLKPSASRSN